MVQSMDINKKLESILDKEEIKNNVLMKSYTSFRVGGPADVFVTPNSYEKIRDVIKICKQYNVPYFILGNGSNLLVRDGGIRGVVINFTKLNKILVEETKVIAESGAVLSMVANAALKNDLTGLEFAHGIPGSVGGAVAMNAGAYNGEICQVIESATIIDSDGEIREICKEEMDLSYRNSLILKNGYIVLKATFKLQRGEHDSIKARMDDLMRRRKEKQPLEYPSAGSTFKRPEGYFAAKLIEDSELKGAHVGDAEVSVKHSGFIINKGNASAKDILDLIELVKKTVNDKFQVALNTEVRIVGEDKMN
ncbi:UDP-N-acetylmuramate dehydrogenase [Clostridium botulinum]|uniref:UDP-N-acetylenolpyruvoylglucosamine reductase n=1 Tax=Clostridium botulinum TaxID=1491 RepID=A0A9Q1UZZ0_CLOBO|nr:UDP-N-acetylmuramate dehydrogenase [Clostridium botulinum]AEB75113.1 UDP-N-acetylmuramate dehydrogenase [Clostridium botulinum BKT015925]KEI05631.1 UDP-N-acetylenolpyruvoylglucosamine reductase [Clostridium botulinum C/D str. Sp77]KLU75036.1 UDP-N-acetylenolpyruvoylglucosamine reductase [Clostridium botulinum V891]KOA74343.1 UDP-N-acetylenolpyruvoylglucosamine reductase [Clostridium botulinum]KOA77824.1 UDP-N-acetylenolpyruvoylglucosamine reductase [Clostridium botulinum]